MNQRKTPFTLTVDNDADAAYILMTGRPVAESKEIGGGVIVDLDAMGIVVGIEILGVDTKIPFQRLTDEFHVHTADVAYLKLLQPSIGSFLFQHATDGTTRASNSHGDANQRMILTA